jgi:hypothetical protein
VAGSRDEYEAAAKGLSHVASELVEAGVDVEAVARHVVALRNEMKIRFRDGLPSVVVNEMERRNLDKYDHPIGPTAEWLFEKYGNWVDVAKAAARPADCRARMKMSDKLTRHMSDSVHSTRPACGGLATA